MFDPLGAIRPPFAFALGVRCAKKIERASRDVKQVARGDTLTYLNENIPSPYLPKTHKDGVRWQQDLVHPCHDCVGRGIVYHGGIYPRLR